MSSQLAFKETEFFEQINQFINGTPDSSILAQLRNKAQQRSQFNDVDGYLARGMLAGLEGDVDAINTNYQQAVTTFSNQHAFSLAIYAKSLTLFGQFIQAADLMHKAFELSPSTLSYLDDTIYFHGLAGHFHQVGELLKLWDKQNTNKTHRFSQLSQEIIQFMDAKNVTDTDLEKLLSIALSLLRQHHLTIVTSQTDISLLEEENSQWFHYGIPIQQALPVEKMVALDFELADKMADESLSPTLSAYFVIMFERMDDN
jgi:hypothetical protein